jgi:uncharacterized protein (TIGR03118 family)
MRSSGSFLAVGVFLAATTLTAVPASAQFYQQQNLATKAGDPDLVNPWGLASGPTSPWWLADNGMDKSTLYTAAGIKQGLIVGVAGAPTGVVFNPSAQFVLTAQNNPDGKTGRAFFLFSNEEGAILAWNFSAPANKATVVFPAAGDVSDAVYKGLAIAQFDGTNWRLYASNFRAGTVDVFDSNFAPVPDAGFVDPTLPAGYAPFGIQTIGNVIYVTYALQDEDKKDDVRGPGHGFVNAFDLSGNWLARVASGDPLNSPWGLAWAPADTFGKFSGQLLVGNFGDGRINAFALQSDGTFEATGPLHSASGPPLHIEGLWALQFGKDTTNSGTSSNGNSNQLFFTAGPDDEDGGLFGFLTVAGSPGHTK